VTCLTDHINFTGFQLFASETANIDAGCACRI